MTVGSESDSTVPSVVVHLAGSDSHGSGPGALPSLEGVNDLLFDRLGIIAPAIEVQRSEARGPASVRLALNGVDLGPIDLGSVEESVATLLLAKADQLVVAGLVEHFLARVRSHKPALVDAARTQFSTAEVTAFLRERVRGNRSIRDLAGALDELVAGAAAESASGSRATVS